MATEVGWKEPEVSYAAAAQGIRRFWKRVRDHADMRRFVKALLDQMPNGQIRPHWLITSGGRGMVGMPPPFGWSSGGKQELGLGWVSRLSE
jgi:hypothetical protein